MTHFTPLLPVRFSPGTLAGTAITALLLASLPPGGAPAAEPELVSVKKIWDAGPHNAFTDLLRTEEEFLCVFREARAHVGGEGAIRVLHSAEGETWESAALITEKGIDLRDPKISRMPDGRLMLLMGGSHYEGTKLLGRQPRVAFSRDGRQWSAPERILAEGDWLWRVTWREGKGYGVAYRTEPRREAREASGAPASEWLTTLYETENGVDYRFVTDFEIPNRPNETTLRFLEEGDCLALVRREQGNQRGWIGRSRPPYTAWEWKETEHRLGGPNFLEVPGRGLWGATRIYPGGAKTALARMTAESLAPVLTLPSGGDTSYAGMVWHAGELWLSYYASHEGKSSIYLARLRLPEK